MHLNYNRSRLVYELRDLIKQHWRGHVPQSHSRSLALVGSDAPEVVVCSVFFEITKMVGINLATVILAVVLDILVVGWTEQVALPSMSDPNEEAFSQGC